MADDDNKTELDLEADVALHDLLKIDITYGRLQLLMKAVLDKVRTTSQDMNHMKEKQEAMQQEFDTHVAPLKRTAEKNYASQDDLQALSDAVRGRFTGVEERLVALERITAGLPARLQILEGHLTTPSSGGNRGLTTVPVKSPSTTALAPLPPSDPVPTAGDTPAPPAAAPTTTATTGDSASQASAQPQGGNTYELDDSILDDLMANHERRLRNLEDEIRQKLAAAMPADKGGRAIATMDTYNHHSVSTTSTTTTRKTPGRSPSEGRLVKTGSGTGKRGSGDRGKGPTTTSPTGSTGSDGKGGSGGRRKPVVAAAFAREASESGQDSSKAPTTKGATGLNSARSARSTGSNDSDSRNRTERPGGNSGAAGATTGDPEGQPLAGGDDDATLRGGGEDGGPMEGVVASDLSTDLMSGDETSPNQAPIGDAIDAIVAAPHDGRDSYQAIGARPSSADRRLLRSGLTDRLRNLTDDHERRLKSLEVFSHELSQRPQVVHQHIHQTSGVGEDQLNDLNSSISQLATRIDAKDDPERYQLLLARLEELEGRVARQRGGGSSSSPSLQGGNSDADPARLAATEDSLRDMKVMLLQLQSNMDHLMADDRKGEEATKEVRQMKEDLKLLVIRVDAAEQMANALTRQPPGDTTGPDPARRRTSRSGSQPQEDAILLVKIKALQDTVGVLKTFGDETADLARNVQTRNEELERRVDNNADHITALEDEVRERLTPLVGLNPAEVTAAALAAKEAKDQIQLVDNRLKREEQHIKMLTQKVNTVSARTEKQSKDVPVSAKQEQGMNNLKRDVARAAQQIEAHELQLTRMNQEQLSPQEFNDALNRLADLAQRQKAMEDKLEAVKALASRSRKDAAHAAGGPGGSVPAELTAEVGELKILLQTHGSMIENLFADKANRETVVRQGQEVQELKQLLDARTANRVQPQRNPQPSLADAAALQELNALVGQHTHAIDQVIRTKAEEETLNARCQGLGEDIDNLALNKADCSLVAGKAERDYVENALEKLRREVEQVMNNTNSGLIDTLDKSLQILRDMIDGKANTADMMKLRDAVLSDARKDDTPEGLAGYKHYRCLSCNRKMDGMRPRAMGMNFMNFISHLPNPRNKFYQKTPTGLLPAAHQTRLPGGMRLAEPRHDLLEGPADQVTSTSPPPMLPPLDRSAAGTPVPHDNHVVADSLL